MADFIKYEQSIVKLDKDGNKVLSDTLFPGEKIAHTGETFTQAKARLKALAAEEASGGVAHWKTDAREPQEGNPTSTLDPSMTSTIRGEYRTSGTAQ